MQTHARDANDDKKPNSISKAGMTGLSCGDLAEHRATTERVDLDRLPYGTPRFDPCDPYDLFNLSVFSGDHLMKVGCLSDI
jgi:hypothetical protein